MASPSMWSAFVDDDVRQWRTCARRFWHQRSSPKAPRPALDTADASAEAQVVHGPSPDDALRASFPGAVTIDPPRTSTDWARALRETAAALADERMHQPGEAVLGACLASADGAQVRIDVLQRGDHGLRVFKRRYATVGDEADVDAVALWAHVASHSGLRVQHAGLLLVDTGFMYPGLGCYAGLFREVDLGPVLGSRQVTAWLTAMRACERGAEPAATPGPHCQVSGGCELRSACQPRQEAPARPETCLEVLGRERAAELRDEGHVDLTTVPLQRLTDTRHRRAWQAVRQGAPVFEPALAARVGALPYPRHVLRIDTIGFAVPVWAGTQPYQVLPFQWTCDVIDASGTLQQRQFLADAQGDPRRRFAETLLQALGHEGAVLAYNAGFERNRIRDLARTFDDLAAALDALLPRIVDLFQVARAHVYHPAMAGSWSFKSVCRAFAPTLAADAFPDDPPGADPSGQMLFAQSLRRGLSEAERERLRALLLARGQAQVGALRELVRVFEASTPTGG